MESQLQFIEGESATNVDDQLAIENKVFCCQLRQPGNDVGEIARERLSRFRLQVNVLSAPKCETAEAIPFGFVLPAIAGRNFVDRAGFHRRKRWLDHSQWNLALSFGGGIPRLRSG